MIHYKSSIFDPTKYLCNLVPASLWYHVCTNLLSGAENKLF